MTRIPVFLLLIFSSFSTLAQVQVPESTSRTTSNLPAGYYSTAAGLSCSNLKSALFTIISANTTELLYSELWATYPRTDKRRNDSNTEDVVWDMYSDNPTGPDPYVYRFVVNQCGNYNREGDCYNRDHTFPQSWFNDALPMRSDMNHIFPTDGAVNGLRGNFPFGEVSTLSSVSSNQFNPTLNGGKLGTGSNFGYNGVVFEPINAYKGDLARAILYMAVRYESQIAGWRTNGNADNVLDGSSYQVFDPWHLRLLFKWHEQDPVSQKERDRNDSVFVIQGNRNPFIDHPEWVFEVWRCTGLLSPTGLNDVLNLPVSAVRLYPNPVYRTDVQLEL
ncbi:MAG TPA: endonuclease, partial [Lacibacter sp.]|nr:endonuclease [Lacibacter sp.]